MELKEDLVYKQLMQVIKELPEDKILQLKAELSSFLPTDAKKPINSFQEFLLNGPVMNNAQYKTYKENRNHFNKWRTK